MPVIIGKELVYYLYSDTRPHTGKASPVQKGLVPGLRDNDAMLCEEGLGFGVPVLQYARDFYFPGSANTTTEGKVPVGASRKCYQYNLVERAQRPDDRSIRPFSWVIHRLYNSLYKTRAGYAAISICIPPNLSQRYGIKLPRSKFIHVRDKGWSCSTYTLDSAKGTILVTIELDGVSHEGLQQVYVSNEMGGSLFTHYCDSSGLKLRGEEITGWSEIDAGWAAMYAPSIGLGFRVDFPSNIIAFRGRETFSKDVSWSGMILAVSPSTDKVEYRVRLGAYETLVKDSP